jgi:hypothetical protein
MIVRPTTDQVLLDCCRVLTDDVLPHIDDETTQVCVVMLAKVLRNTAVRAAHEIAWMRDEISAVESYARAVGAAAGDQRVDSALEQLTEAPRDSLHLADVAEVYCRAGDLLSACLEVAIAGNFAALVRDGETLLAERLARESEVVGGWDSAGR